MSTNSQADPRLTPRPELSKRSTIVEIHEFFPELVSLARPGKRAKARLWCKLCGRHHHLHWGEMQNAVKDGAATLDEIVAHHSDKYCHVRRDSFEFNIQGQDTHQEKADRFTEELHAMHEGVYVVECVHRFKNVFAMKIETPRGVYLDEASAQDWRNLVRRDIQWASEPPKCPFCNGEVDMETDPARRMGPAVAQCQGCGAKGHRDFNSMPELDDLQSGVAWRLLSRFNGLFVAKEMPSGATLLWARSSLGEAAAGTDAPEFLDRLQGPWDGVSPLKQDMPLLLNVEESDDDDIAAVRAAKRPSDLDLSQLLRDQRSGAPVLRFPDCSLCRHAFQISNGNGYLPSDISLCAYPATGEEVLAHAGHPNEYMTGLDFLNARDDRDYCGSDATSPLKLWNHVLDVALEPFADVTNQERGLEGLDPSAGSFTGPLCPRFATNTNHIDLMRGSLYELAPFTAPLVFGVENFAAIQRGKEEQQKKEIYRQKKAELDVVMAELRRLSLEGGPAHQIMKARVTMENIDSEVAEQVVGLILQQVPRELLEHPGLSQEDTLRPFFNASRKALQTLIDRAVKAARQHIGVAI